MSDENGSPEIEELRAEVARLEKELALCEEEKQRLRSTDGLPDPRDIVAILRRQGVRLSPRQEARYHDFWNLVIYPSRHLKRGLARKEMVLECREHGIPWGMEPVRKAVNLLRSHGLLTKRRTHYPVDLKRLRELSR